MTTPALSMYDIQCDACHQWKHYKEEYNWRGGKRSLKCKDCQGKSSEPVTEEPSEPIVTPKPKRRKSGKQAAPKRRVKNLQQLRHPDPILAEIDRIADFEDRMDSPIAWYGMKKSIIDWTLSIIEWPEKPHHLFVDGCGGSATVLLKQATSHR